MCVQCGAYFVRAGVWCFVCVRWCVRCGACAESVCDARFVFWCCGVLCCVVMCGVGAGVGVQYVVCGVSVVCVTRLGTRKTPPCVGSKRLHVHPQKRAHVEHKRAFCRYTRRLFVRTHGDVLNLHTGGPSLSLSLPSFFLHSFSAVFSLVFSLSSCSAPMTIITPPVGSLYTKL